MSWRSAAPSRRPLGFVTPQIPTRADKVPVGPQRIHEIKHDGYRLIVRRQGERVRLFTRRGYDWSDPARTSDRRAHLPVCETVITPFSPSIVMEVSNAAERARRSSSSARASVPRMRAGWKSFES
jgi:ATP-dependent DNA ligase